MRRTLTALAIPFFTFILCCQTPLSLAQGQGGGGKGGGASNNNSPPSNGNQNQGSSPGGNGPSSPSSPGITGGAGSMGIESTIFAYKALASDATAIANAVISNVKGKVVVVATPADFASLVQWRTTIYQIELLDGKLAKATAALDKKNIPDFLKTPQGSLPSVPTVGGGPFVASPSDVQTLVQTLASIFAVNESVSVGSGDLTTIPLTNRLADLLRQKGATIYVPSVYSPNLLAGDDIGATFVGNRLTKLETDRAAAVDAAQAYSLALADAQTISGCTEGAGGPVATSISPTSGPAGTKVTIIGSNLGDTPAGATAPTGAKVTFRGTTATIVRWTSSSVVATVPALVPAAAANAPLPVVLTLGSQNITLPNFINTNAPASPAGAPAATSINPNTGSAGTQVAISGSNFGDAPAGAISPSGATVTFAGTPGTIVTWTPSTIVVKAPSLTPAAAAGASIPVVVTVSGQSTNPLNFTNGSASGPATAAAVAAAQSTCPNKGLAQSFIATYTLQFQTLSALIPSVDALESTLLTGQAGTPTNQNNTQQQTTPGNGNPPGGPGSPPLTGNGNGNANANGNANGNGNTGNGTNTPVSLMANASQTPLQQILPADLLAHQIWGGQETPSNLQNIDVLVIQTLESGGNQLTKSNLFLGSRIYFNGGAVATFSLYGIDGALQCGGFVYGYGGYAKDSNFSKDINRPRAVVGDNTCSPPTPAP
jgi:hypothetical protein